MTKKTIKKQDNPYIIGESYYFNKIEDMVKQKQSITEDVRDNTYVKAVEQCKKRYKSIGNQVWCEEGVKQARNHSDFVEK